MKYFDNIKALDSLYRQKGIQNNFSGDNTYLENAFSDIHRLWLDNFNQIDIVKYLMIAEAPLWGSIKKYIYNPTTNNSQFFYRNDLGDILDKNIIDKTAFIKCCNEIGLLIIDISPFALNPTDTQINYRQISVADYRQLVSSTIPTFFTKIIELICKKKSKNIQVFFRYARVRHAFQDLIAPILVNNNLIGQMSDIGDISQNGGGIDKEKLRQIIKKNVR